MTVEIIQGNCMDVLREGATSISGAVVKDWASYYQDTGCSVAPSCLSCPLDQCRYDVRLPKVQKLRDAEIIRAREQGVSIDDVAGLVGASRRTVFRALSGVPHLHPNEVEAVLDGVCKEHGVTLDQLRGKSKVKRICEARHVAMYRLREIRDSDGYPMVYKAIGLALGKHYSSAICGVRRGRELSAA